MLKYFLEPGVFRSLSNLTGDGTVGEANLARFGGLWFSM